MDLSDLTGRATLPPSFPLPRDRPFTYRTAVREGVTSRELQWLVDQGFLARPIRGVYVDTQVPDTIELRCACLRLVVPADAVVCDRHAGWLHGAEMVLAPGEHLELDPIRIFLPSGRGRLRNQLADSGERLLRPGDIDEVMGLRVTSPLRTACDLGRSRWIDRSVASMDQMLRLGRFSKTELLAEVERFKGMRWVTVLRAAAPLIDGRAESPPESVLRLRWIEAQLPAPVPQLDVWSGDRFLARLDLANEDLLYAAEYDGDEWHSGPDQQEHDRARRLACEREAGWFIKAFTKENLFGPRQDAELLLRRDLLVARRRFGISA